MLSVKSQSEIIYRSPNIRFMAPFRHTAGIYHAEESLQTHLKHARRTFASCTNVSAGSVYGTIVRRPGRASGRDSFGCWDREYGAIWDLSFCGDNFICAVERAKDSPECR